MEFYLMFKSNALTVTSKVIKLVHIDWISLIVDNFKSPLNVSIFGSNYDSMAILEFSFNDVLNHLNVFSLKIKIAPIEHVFNEPRAHVFMAPIEIWNFELDRTYSIIRWTSRQKYAKMVHAQDHDTKHRLEHTLSIFEKVWFLVLPKLNRAFQTQYSWFQSNAHIGYELHL